MLFDAACQLCARYEVLMRRFGDQRLINTEMCLKSLIREIALDVRELDGGEVQNEQRCDGRLFIGFSGLKAHWCPFTVNPPRI